MHTIHLCFNIPDMNCVNLLADVRPLASLMHIQPKFPSCWHSKQFILYISALYSSKNSSCTLNYCVFFSRILMNEIWCLFLSSKRQGSWFNMAAPLCIYINDKDTQNKVSYINNGRSPPFTFWLIIYLRSFLLLTIYIFVFRKSIMFCKLFYRIWIEKRSIFTHVFMEAVYIATSNSITLKVHVHN